MLLPGVVELFMEIIIPVVTVSKRAGIADTKQRLLRALGCVINCI